MSEYPNNIEIAKKLLEQQAEINRLQGELAGFERFHPIAMKLLRWKKNFVVVSEDEQYFKAVYDMIRDFESGAGRWTFEDEQKYQAAMREVGE